MPLPSYDELVGTLPSYDELVKTDGEPSDTFAQVTPETTWQPQTAADIMSSRFDALPLEQRKAAMKRIHIPTINEVGIIPAPIIEAAMKYASPVGWAEMASEAIEPGNAASRISKGVTSGVANTLAGFTTPEGLQALAIMPQSRIGQILLGLGFEAKAVADVPAQVKAYGATDDPQEKAKIATEIAASVGLPAMAVAHGVSPRAELPQPNPQAVPMARETQAPSGESLTKTPSEMVREGPPSAEDAKGLPISRPVTQRFVQPEGNPVVPESETTAAITRDALAWRNELLQEGQKLGEQARLMGQMGQRIPKPLADRIAEINAELARGFQPKPQEHYELRGETEQVAAQSDIAATPQSPVRPADNRTQLETVEPAGAVRQTEAAFVPESVPRPETSTPEVESATGKTVRLYHGGNTDQAGSDFTPFYEYAKGYADKATGGNGKVWYVDVPKGSLKTHDEYGQPMSRVIVPDEIADQAKPLTQESVKTEPVAPNANAASVPVMITKRMEAELRARGVTEEQINKMTPAEAHEILKAEPTAPSPDVQEAPVPETTTGVANRVLKAEREARGFPEAEEAARRDFGTVWDEAEGVAKSDPSAPQRLVESIRDKPRALTDQENALLLRRQIEVRAEHDAAIKAVNEATSEAERDFAQARLENIRNDLQTVYDAAKSAGTETGRGLNARKMLANQDFTLAKMEAETRAVVNGGKPLSPTQANEVRMLHARIAIAEAKVAAYEARDQFNSELRQARRSGVQPDSFLEQQAQKARERIAARRGKLYSDPVGVTQIAHLADEAIIGASHIARGVRNFTDWSKAMLSEFGDRIKPFLHALFAKAQSLHSETAKRTVASPEERVARGLEGDKKRIASNIAKVTAKTAAGDFTPSVKAAPRMDAEKTALLFEYQKAKEAYTRKLVESRLANQTALQKTRRYATETLNTARAIKTSFDVSAVLRQGGLIAVAHPIRALRALEPMFRALVSEKEQFRIHEEIRSRPNAALYKQSGLELTEFGSPGTSLSKMEEVFMSRLAEKIPGVRASERAYITFLNRLRADSFDAMKSGLSRAGKVTLDEARIISNYINVATGRGDLGRLQTAATALNTAFFAPRYVASRFQFLLGQPLVRNLGKGSFRVRRMVAAEYARTLAGLGVFLGLGALVGAEINGDPNNPDFLKLRFGNTRLDPLAGLVQPTVFLSREANAIRRFVTQSKEKEPKYGSGGDVLVRFLRSKLAPAPGTAWDIIEGKNVVGQKVTPMSAFTGMIVPLSFGDIYSAMQEQGIAKGAALGLLSLFGMGLQTYGTKAKAPTKTKTLREGMDDLRQGRIKKFLTGK